MALAAASERDAPWYVLVRLLCALGFVRWGLAVGGWPGTMRHRQDVLLQGCCTPGMPAAHFGARARTHTRMPACPGLHATSRAVKAPHEHNWPPPPPPLAPALPPPRPHPQAVSGLLKGEDVEAIIALEQLAALMQLLPVLQGSSHVGQGPAPHTACMQVLLFLCVPSRVPALLRPLCAPPPAVPEWRCFLPARHMTGALRASYLRSCCGCCCAVPGAVLDATGWQGAAAVVLRTSLSHSIRSTASAVKPPPPPHASRLLLPFSPFPSNRAALAAC